MLNNNEQLLNNKRIQHSLMPSITTPAVITIFIATKKTIQIKTDSNEYLYAEKLNRRTPEI